MTKKKFSFKEAMLEVEEIMHKLEREEVEIDQLAANVKKAGELISKCKEQLRIAEDEVEKIVEEMQIN